MTDLIRTILIMSISGSIIAALLFALKPLVKNRLPKAVQYYLGGVISFVKDEGDYKEERRWQNSTS